MDDKIKKAREDLVSFYEGMEPLLKSPGGSLDFMKIVRQQDEEILSQLERNRMKGLALWEASIQLNTDFRNLMTEKEEVERVKAGFVADREKLVQQKVSYGKFFSTIEQHLQDQEEKLIALKKREDALTKERQGFLRQADELSMECRRLITKYGWIVEGVTDPNRAQPPLSLKLVGMGKTHELATYQLPYVLKTTFTEMATTPPTSTATTTTAATTAATTTTAVKKTKAKVKPETVVKPDRSRDTDELLAKAMRMLDDE